MKALFMLFITFILSACGAGSGEGLNSQGRPLEETIEPPDTNVPTDMPDDTIQPTLASIQAHVFTPICAVCHGGVSPAAGQDLSTIEKTIANLVDVDSANPMFKRVLPGSPEQSYLYLKITGDSQAGAKMPLGQPALADEAVNAIKQWITEGAMVPDSNTTPTIVSKVQTKLSNNSLANHQGTASFDYLWANDKKLVIVIWFNKPMNFSALTASQILLKASSTATATMQPLWLPGSDDLSINVVNKNVLQININGLDDAISRLRITLNDGSISTMASASGQPLDGDFDGIEGGAFSYDLNF